MKNATTIPEIQNEIVGGFRVCDMEKVFNRMVDPKDWRAPINATIPYRLYDIAAAAVEFFTATTLEVVGSMPITGDLLVKSIGYRAGPAGDH